MEQNKASDLDRLVDKKCYTAIYNAVSQYVEDNPDALELSGVWTVNTFLDSFYKVYSPGLLLVSDSLMSCEFGNC